MARREEVLEVEEELQEVRDLFKAYRVQATRKIQALRDENDALKARLEEAGIASG